MSTAVLDNSNNGDSVGTSRLQKAMSNYQYHRQFVKLSSHVLNSF